MDGGLGDGLGTGLAEGAGTAEVAATAAGEPAAALSGEAVVGAVARGAVCAEKGVHPARTSTKRAMPLRVRRIHPE